MKLPVLISDEVRRDMAEHTAYLGKEYSRGSKGYDSTKELRHGWVIYKCLINIDPNLLLWQKADLAGDTKEARKHFLRYLDMYPECKIVVTK